MRMISKDKIIELVMAGLWTKQDVIKAKNKGYITIKEYNEILAECPGLNNEE